ncbi:MAG: Lrp/AsnC family transcriptional regulator [Nanoarchaeota archaeon]
MNLDAKDREILNLLQEDGRMSLTKIAKKIDLSIDSTHKRIKKMQKEEVFFSTILVDPRKIGYPLAMDVKVKLKSIETESHKRFIAYLCEHPNVISVFAVAGDYDLSIPIIAKSHTDLNDVTMKIREKFKDLIADWRTALNLDVYKYESYNMKRL